MADHERWPVTLAVRLSDDQAQSLRVLAERQHTSLSSVMRQALDRFLTATTLSGRA